MAPPSFLSPYRRGLVWLILLAGAGLSFLAWYNARRNEAERIRNGFTSRAQTQAAVASQRLQAYKEMVYSLRDSFLGQEDVTRAEFARVAQSLLDRHPGVQALQWVRIVPTAERAALERKATAELGRPFVIRRLMPDRTFQPAPEDHEYFVITYSEPVLPNLRVLGYDVTSAATAPLLRAARGDRGFKVSAAFQLAQSNGHAAPPGVVFILPFWQAAPADAPVEGFVQGVFYVQTMLAQSHQLTTTEALDTYYFDITDAGPPALLYANLGGREPLQDAGARLARPPLDAPGDVHSVLHIGGRRWLMVIRPNAAWTARNSTNQPGASLAGGLTITALLALFINNLLQRTSRIEQEVAKRTRELRASEARLQAILDHSPAIIFVKDLEGRYLLFNRPFITTCPADGRPIQGRTDRELFPAADAALRRAHDERVLASGRPEQFEEASLLPDGTPAIRIVQKFPLLDEDGKPYALCGIATDITDRKAAEEQRLALERQLLESQKLESLGVLAGGVAHDFNNILTAILGNATLARFDLPAGHVAHPHLQQIERAARRAGDLCAQMLAYAGKAAFVTAPVNLTALVRDTAALLEVSVAKRARLELALREDLPAVNGDITQLRQIVMNLVINAADAMGDRSDGEISVRTFWEERTAEFFRNAVHAPELAPGRYVGLEVTDNGSGMPPEVVARIFEPFFTTKFSGRGLGLAAVLGIVHGHDGALFVESAVRRGTTFRLYFPAGARPAPPQAPQLAVPAPAPRLKGTVLIVDDEEPVRHVAAEALRLLGITPLEAANGHEALRQVGQHHATINLILLDLTMPGLNGEETLRQLRQTHPDLRVVIMSGYSEGETMTRCASLGATGFLAKPFEIGDLVERLRPHLG